MPKPSRPVLPDELAELRQMRAQGMSLAALALLSGLHRSRIARLVAGVLPLRPPELPPIEEDAGRARPPTPEDAAARAETLRQIADADAVRERRLRQDQQGFSPSSGGKSVKKADDEIELLVTVTPELRQALCDARLAGELRPGETMDADRVAKAIRRLVAIVEARIVLPEIRQAHTALCTREIFSAGMAEVQREREQQRQASATMFAAPPVGRAEPAGLELVERHFQAREAEEAERGAA